MPCWSAGAADHRAHLITHLVGCLRSTLCDGRHERQGDVGSGVRRCRPLRGPLALAGEGRRGTLVLVSAAPTGVSVRLSYARAGMDAGPAGAGRHAQHRPRKTPVTNGGDAAPTPTPFGGR